MFLNLGFAGQAFLRSKKTTGCWKSHTPPEAEDEVIMGTVFAAISHGVSYRYMNCSVSHSGISCCVYACQLGNKRQIVTVESYEQ